MSGPAEIAQAAGMLAVGFAALAAAFGLALARSTFAAGAWITALAGLAAAALLALGAGDAAMLAAVLIAGVGGVIWLGAWLLTGAEGAAARPGRAPWLAIHAGLGLAGALTAALALEPERSAMGEPAARALLDFGAANPVAAHLGVYHAWIAALGLLITATAALAAGGLLGLGERAGGAPAAVPAPRDPSLIAELIGKIAAGPLALFAAYAAISAGAGPAGGFAAGALLALLFALYGLAFGVDALRAAVPAGALRAAMAAGLALAGLAAGQGALAALAPGFALRGPAGLAPMTIAATLVTAGAFGLALQVVAGWAAAIEPEAGPFDAGGAQDRP